MVPGFLRHGRSLASFALVACFTISVPFLAQAEPVAQPVVTAALGTQQVSAGDGVRTRFVIGLDKDVIFQVFSLSNPNRVIVELPDVQLSLPASPGSTPVGLVKSFRGGLAAPGKSRVVIDVTQPVVVESAKIEKGKDGKSRQLALQIVPVDDAIKFASKNRKTLTTPPFSLGAAGIQPPMARRAKRPEERRARAFKPIIVLDPGHGGHDSGAKKNGAVEKEIVLEFGKILREKLEKSGRYRVLMTRDVDKFVELSERVDYAEKNKANLFIAIHCDYARTSARGATIYSLRESTAEGLKRSAKGEVSENVLSSSELAKLKTASLDNDAIPVRGILADLAKREVETTKERTSMFTQAVVANMSETTSMRDDPDKSAGFRVLKTAQFPSVLIELAYVTNKEDAALLLSDEWRDNVSTSIMTAIENYFSNSHMPL